MIENKKYLTDFLQITVNGENMSQETIETIINTINDRLKDTNIAKNIHIELENEDYSELDFYEFPIN